LLADRFRSKLRRCVGSDRPAVSRRGADKQSLYGDAGLVPTREGERVRRELALAGELRHALEQLGLTAVHVDVELREPAGVIVVGRAAANGDHAELEAAIVDFAHVLVPDASAVHVRLSPAESEIESPAPAPNWTIALVCLGLGLSLGITVERLLARRLVARMR
jgi:hypothetical protein